MRILPLGALLPVLMVLAACSGQTPTPATTPTSVAITAEPSSIALSPTDIIPTPPPQGTPATTTATATPTPASSLETSTPVPTQEPTMDALPPPRDRRLLWRSPSLQSQRTSRSTAGPNGTTGPTRMETAKTPGRRPSSQRAWLRSPLSPKGSAGSQRVGGTVHSLASTSRRLET